ncbi:MAG: ROK family protein [Acidobacteriaceae bacterium]|nr:ROK family protein [Acidobacteriaceae bacterium]
MRTIPPNSAEPEDPAALSKRGQAVRKEKLVDSRTRRGIKRGDLPDVELASSESARDINRDVVLEIVRAQQPISRADVARASGLQPSTISNIVEQLLNEKWIAEGAAAIRPRGRRPTLLTLNEDLVILVADIRPGRAILAVVDLNGRLLAHEQRRITPDPKRSVQVIADAMVAMQARFPAKTFEGVGVSLPGRVDPISNNLILSPNLTWTGYNIKAPLERSLGLKVDLDNAANAALLAELWFGHMDGVRNAVLITISEGLGAAILANGHIVTGLNGMAGEFGHISLDANGVLCGCGRRGCWETLASSNAALRFYKEQNTGNHVGNIQDLLSLADANDPAAVRAIEIQAHHLGRGLRLITSALSPEVILISGAIVDSWERFGPLVLEEMREGVLAGSAPRLLIVTEGDLARLRGAAVVSLQRNSGYNKSTLPTTRKR